MVSHRVYPDPSTQCANNRSTQHRLSLILECLAYLGRYVRAGLPAILQFVCLCSKLLLPTLYSTYLLPTPHLSPTYTDQLFLYQSSTTSSPLARRLSFYEKVSLSIFLFSLCHERLGRRLPQERHEIELPPPGLILPSPPPPSRTTISTLTKPQSLFGAKLDWHLVGKSFAQSKLFFSFFPKPKSTEKDAVSQNHSSIVTPPLLPAACSHRLRVTETTSIRHHGQRQWFKTRVCHGQHVSLASFLRPGTLCSAA